MEQSEENKLIESSNKYILNLIFSVQKSSRILRQSKTMNV